MAIPQDICEFAISTRMNIYQIASQRTYGPSLEEEQLRIPNKGSEVYVGNLPRNCFEPELVPFLQKVGPLSLLRLIIKADGTTNGYAFATYYDSFTAEKAVAELNGTLIRQGYHVQVSPSIERSTLILIGVPTTQSLQEIEAAITQIVFGVVKVQLLWDDVDGNPQHPTGKVSVTFVNYRAASLARKIINSKLPFRNWGWDIIADWAQPINEANEENTNSHHSHSLYVRSFTRGTKWEELWHYMESLEIRGLKFVQMSKLGIYAFVSFYEKTDAENARLILDGCSFQGKTLHAEWIRPKGTESYARYQGLKQQMEDYELGQQQDVENVGEQVEVQQQVDAQARDHAPGATDFPGQQAEEHGGAGPTHYPGQQAGDHGGAGPTQLFEQQAGDHGKPGDTHNFRQPDGENAAGPTHYPGQEAEEHAGPGANNFSGEQPGDHGEAGATDFPGRQPGENAEAADTDSYYVPLYMVAPNLDGFPGIGFIPFYIDWNYGMPLSPVPMQPHQFVPIFYNDPNVPNLPNE